MREPETPQSASGNLGLVQVLQRLPCQEQSLVPSWEDASSVSFVLGFPQIPTGLSINLKLEEDSTEDQRGQLVHSHTCGCCLDRL